MMAWFSEARVDMKYLLSEREINIGPQFDGLRFDRNISDFANEDDSDDDEDDDVVQVDFDLAGATRDGNEDDERNSEGQEKPITKPLSAPNITIENKEHQITGVV